VLEHTPESPPPGRRAQVSQAAIGARYPDGTAQKPVRLSLFGEPQSPSLLQWLAELFALQGDVEDVMVKVLGGPGGGLLSGGRPVQSCPDMPRQEVIIKTRDGDCSAWVFTPADGAGPWPGVIFYMDGFGIRQAMWEMGQRLADGGYLVLLPDLYYRQPNRAAMTPAQVIAEPKLREELMKLVGGLDRDKKIADTAAFVEFLLKRKDVKGNRFGATGYCMGGNISLTAAGAFPARFAAVASFHGGNLATDQPDSPHLFVKDISARVYVAGADGDAHFTVEQKERLERALSEAGVEHVVEIYAGARHGFAVPDVPAFNAAAAERHWEALFGLFREAFAATS